MAFINELVPEELKPTFDIEVFYDPRRTLFKQMSFYRWVVDHERNLFLIRLGGGGSWEGEGYPKPSEYFAFSYKGEVINFESLYSSNNYKTHGGDLIGYWEIFNINLSSSLANKREEIQQLLKEAFEAYGDSLSNRVILSGVEVTFK